MEMGPHSNTDQPATAVTEAAEQPLAVPPSTGELVLPRRTLLWAGLGAFVTVATGVGIGYARRESDKGRQVAASVDQYVSDMMAALPTGERLRADMGRIPGIRDHTDLGRFAVERGLPASEPVSYRVLYCGTSMAYVLGTMNDTTGPFNQPHSITQLAFDGLDDQARMRLGLADTEVMTVAVPGAQSGPSGIPEARGRYDLLAQLSGPAAQSWLLQLPPDALCETMYDCFGLDDLRNLAATMQDFKSRVLGPILSLGSTATASKQVRHLIDGLRAEVDGIADNYCRNLIAAGTIIAVIDRHRQDEGRSGVRFRAVYAEDIALSRFAPFAPVQNSAMSISQFVVPDPVDPAVSGRAMLDLDQIPYGRDFAHYSWVRFFQAQTNALVALATRYPQLAQQYEDQTQTNAHPGFYTVALAGQPVYRMGDGHRGWIDAGIGGSVLVMRQRLNGLRRGENAAGAYADFGGTRLTA